MFRSLLALAALALLSCSSATEPASSPSLVGSWAGVSVDTVAFGDTVTFDATWTDSQYRYYGGHYFGYGLADASGAALGKQHLQPGNAIIIQFAGRILEGNFVTSDKIVGTMSIPPNAYTYRLTRR